MPQMIVQFPQMIAIMESMRTMMLTMHSTMSGIYQRRWTNQRYTDCHGEGVRRRQE